MLNKNSLKSSLTIFSKFKLISAFTLKVLSMSCLALLVASKSFAYDYPVIGVTSSSDGSTSLDGSFRISWTTIHANSYIYYQWQENGGPWTSIGTTSYVDFERPDGTYRIDVRVCQPGYCSNSKYRTVTVSIQDSLKVKYKYDALGRLTYVEDELNGHRDYDYDPAGNRTRLDTNVTSDDDNSDLSGGEDILPAPTGLVYGGPYSYGYYRFQWDQVQYAVSYKITFSNASGSGTTSYMNSANVRYFDSQTFPLYVQACNGDGLCGDKAYY